MSTAAIDTILSICIPTYNRRAYLERALDRLLPQIAMLNGKVDLHITDNASTDGTKELCEQYLVAGHAFTYARNAQNFGPDYNVAISYRKGLGRFVWVLGDDELIAENALAPLVALLESNLSAALVYLRSTIHPDQVRAKEKLDFSRYRKAGEFANRVGVYFTFISALIINRQVAGDVDRYVDKYRGTFLGHLAWILSALKNGSGYIQVDTKILLVEPNNSSGGFNFFGVFIKNHTEIVEEQLGRDSDSAKAIKRSTAKWAMSYVYRKKDNITPHQLMALADKAFSDILYYRWLYRPFFSGHFLTDALLRFRYDVVPQIRQKLHLR